MPLHKAGNLLFFLLVDNSNNNSANMPPRRQRRRRRSREGNGSDSDEDDEEEEVVYGIRRSRRATTWEYRDSSAVDPAQRMEQDVHYSTAEDLLQQSFMILSIIASLFTAREYLLLIIRRWQAMGGRIVIKQLKGHVQSCSPVVSFISLRRPLGIGVVILLLLLLLSAERRRHEITKSTPIATSVGEVAIPTASTVITTAVIIGVAVAAVCIHCSPPV